MNSSMYFTQGAGKYREKVEPQIVLFGNVLENCNTTRSKNCIESGFNFSSVEEIIGFSHITMREEDILLKMFK